MMEGWEYEAGNLGVHSPSVTSESHGMQPCQQHCWEALARAQCGGRLCREGALCERSCSWMGHPYPQEERRVVFIGKIPSRMTRSELRHRFSVFGDIEECTLHFRSEG